jgi:ubiquinone/menaquinone biosynthesis C-methylase UbiE
MAELERRGAQAAGVDSSAEMLAEARGRLGLGAELRLGAAEALPFPDGRFERAVLRLVVHLVDRVRALPELARVLSPEGAAVIATFRPEHFDRFWLNAYFPSVRAIDIARFPDPTSLARELLHAGFATVDTRSFTQRRVTTRTEALDRIRGRFISTLQLLPEEEFRAGLATAERDFPPELEYELHWAILVARKSV